MQSSPPAAGSAPPETAEPDPRDLDYPPASGIASSLVPVPGGAEAFAAAYEKYGEAERRERLRLLEEALGEYVYGDPRQPQELEKYAALKEEAVWLRGHILP